MIDLKKEIEKYKPVLEIDGIEEEINKSDIEDLLDIVSMIKQN